jgi:hypothetical protein
MLGIGFTSPVLVSQDVHSGVGTLLSGASGLTISFGFSNVPALIIAAHPLPVK